MGISLDFCFFFRDTQKKRIWGVWDGLYLAKNDPGKILHTSGMTIFSYILSGNIFSVKFMIFGTFFESGPHGTHKTTVVLFIFFSGSLRDCYP